MIRCVALAVAFGLLLPSAAGAQVQGLEVVKPDAVSLTRTDGDSSAASVWIRNTTGNPVTPAFHTSVEDADGDVAHYSITVVDDHDAEIDTREIPTGGVLRYRIVGKSTDRKKDAKDASGELVVDGGGAAATVPLTIAGKSLADNGVTGVLWAPVPVALLLVLVAGLVALGGTTGLGSPLPSDLDFKTSYASTVTAAGALLGLVSSTMIPEHGTTLSKEAFTALNLVFGVAVAVAGLVYTTVQRPVWVDVPAEKGKHVTKQQRKSQGFVGGFLIASLVTVWAAFGELLTLWLLLDELGEDQGFSPTALGAIKGLLIVAALLLVVYTFLRLPAIVVSERNKPEKHEKRHAVRSGDSRTIDPSTAPVRSVPLL